MPPVEATQPPPTATPSTYTVVEGDTFFTIAARHDISLEALQAANPDVNPSLISPGLQILIPAAGSSAPLVPSPTPAPVAAEGVSCYSSALGELWCFLLVRNDNAVPLENLTGSVRLLDAAGKILSSLDASPPLDVLYPGESMPLIAYSDDPPENWVATNGQVLSAYALAGGSQYYLSAVLDGAEIAIAENGLSAQATGEITISSGAKPSTLWVVAAAFDGQGEVVGVRKWESAGDLTFDLTVYSLGPEISTVELLVEALP